MKIPIQRRPQHHGYLSRRACGGFEIVTGRVRDGGYKEIVVAQRRFLEGMDMVPLLPRHAAEFHMFLPIAMERVLVAVVLGLDYDGPSCWKDVLVQIQLDRFEEVAAEDGLDGQVLSIGKMHDSRNRGHPSGALVFSQTQGARCDRCAVGVLVLSN